MWIIEEAVMKREYLSSGEKIFGGAMAERGDAREYGVGIVVEEMMEGGEFRVCADG